MGKRTQNYRATLGHKINHSFKVDELNCRFEAYHHARFGLIHAVRSGRLIKKNEELLSHYNLPYEQSPPWYQELWRKGMFRDFAFLLFC